MSDLIKGVYGKKYFSEKIENEIKIEPKDWMPDAYRKTLSARSASMHIAKS